MVKKFFFLALIICTSKCATPQQMIEKINGQSCFANKIIDDERLKQSGYYEFKLPFRNSKKLNVPMDTTKWGVVFYEDGFFVENLDINFFNDNGDKRGFYARSATHFGCYNIDGDTIKAHFFNSPGDMASAEGFVWYRIIDTNSIEEIAFQYYDTIRAETLSELSKNVYRKNISVGKYRWSDRLPNPNKSWLKRKKWFWCDPKEWEKWMKEKGYRY
ncbi:MAG TPA: hypothetical protein VFV37_06555 [Luteibaculaceae bacterium]|nr:hypothetical protein [Luteibaculaceae bacterium]